MQKGSDRRGDKDENVLGTQIELDIDESKVVAMPLRAGMPLNYLDALSV
eukprot:COSAG02_NODE_312_length_24941_cov_60.672611_5_plen_49_part_00